MKVTFIGAAHEVTGSRTLIECGNSKILVDYGMEQGRNEFENIDLPVPPSEIDCVFLTHAHIDHSGHLPLLYKQGFRGKVYSTEATCSLCHIMLLDSAHIQESDVEWKNRKAKRAGRPEVEPLYTVKDAEGVLQLFHTCPYGRRIQVEEGIEIRFQDMGHLLGSSAVEIWLKEGDVEKKIVFSGDVGNSDQPIINDPQPVSEADYVVIESTYGNRNHGPRPDYVESLSKILQETFDRGGNVVIPSFAVGRTQEMLYFLRQIKQQGLVKGHDGFPVYVDSPLANEATRVFLQCHSENFDPEMKALVRQGINPIWSDGLQISVTAEESKAINFDPKPKVILAASGMCDAGRIRHHLKHNLWRKESTVLFVGYQSVGTLGRVLV
ncbi:MAG: MBL fold metallo-hydrolase, partial [Lachnospiraceae bacterium]|nr:MBL fold metallo-hydrolase [Lachnospiraceae bacterium]